MNHCNLVNSIVGLSVLILFSVGLKANEMPQRQQLTLGRIGDSDIQQRAATILSKAYKELGIAVTFEGYPSKRALHYSNNGVIDGELLRVQNIEKQYPNLICVKIPLYQIAASAYTIHGRATFDSIDQLLDSSLAIHNGVLWEEEFVQKHHNDVLRVNGTLKKFKLLQLGRVEYLLSNQQRAQEIISKHFKDANIKQVQPPLKSINLYHYLHKKHRALVPKIQQQLTLIAKRNLLPLRKK